jgi:2-keto-4-pentenoate hydratase/2-oxohepta-3-ene-1,7-dioic acid hydratase in catechol pathway
MGNDESLPYAQYAQRPAPKILGIGLNYLKEGAQGPPNPIVFLKSWSSINYDPKQLSLSLIEESKLIHELELGVMIKSKAFRVSQEEAMNYVGGYFIGIDITDTSKGKPGDYIPETFVKSQDNFCPVSPLIKQKVDPYQIELEYKVYISLI